MNKTDYLIKKGRIPNPANGEMWVIISDRKGVTMSKLPIISSRISAYEIKGNERIPITEHRFDTSPYSIPIMEGETHGIEIGFGSGFGDLWGWTHYGSFSEKEALEYFKQETKRVNDKYFSNNNESDEYIPACG